MATVHEISFNVPLHLRRKHRNLDELALIRQEIWYDYRRVPDLTETYREELDRLNDVPYKSLKARARAYDGPAMFEVALRLVPVSDATCCFLPLLLSGA